MCMYNCIYTQWQIFFIHKEKCMIVGGREGRREGGGERKGGRGKRGKERGRERESKIKAVRVIHIHNAIAYTLMQ